MEIKISREVRLNHEQLVELGDILSMPDMGWGTGTYEVESQGDYGTYIYRVNNSWEMITVLEVK